MLARRIRRSGLTATAGDRARVSVLVDVDDTISTYVDVRSRLHCTAHLIIRARAGRPITTRALEIRPVRIVKTGTRALSNEGIFCR